MDDKIKAALLQEIKDNTEKGLYEINAAFVKADHRVNNTYEDIVKRIEEFEKFPELLSLVTEAEGNIRVETIDAEFTDFLDVRYRDKVLFSNNPLHLPHRKYKIILIAIPEK